MRALTFLSLLLVVLLVNPALGAPQPQPAWSREQLPIGDPVHERSTPAPKDVIKSLKDAEIIPEVLDDDLRVFFLIDAWWNDTLEASLGNNLDPKALQETPSVNLLPAWGFHIPSDDDDDNERSAAGATLAGRHAEALPNAPSVPQNNLVIALTDPDATSSEYCHWIAIGAPLKLVPPMPSSNQPKASTIAISVPVTTYELKDVMPYKPPSPPPKTGKHRYVFVAFAPRNGTIVPLELAAPGNRQHWGGKESGGVRE